MTKPETAILVISGKILDAPFSLDVLDSLRAGIERDLSDRNIFVRRRVATLSAERAIAGPQFLIAGFDVTLAEDEDLQAAAIMTAEAFGADPPDEIVFALGEEAPIQFLRLLAGKTRRIVIARRELSYEIAANIEAAFDLRDVLSKEGIDCSTLNLQTWDEWASEFEASLEGNAADRKSIPASTSDVDDLCKTEELDPVLHFTEIADEWNAELENLLLQNDSRTSAWKTAEQLDQKFPGFLNFYLHNRDEFANLLSDRIKLVEDEVEGETVTYLYHTSHEDMTLMSTSDALEKINIGGGTDDAESTNGASEIEARRYYVPTTFREIAEMANVMTQQALWSAQRDQLLREGKSYESDVAPRDKELEKLAEPYNLYLWQRKLSNLSAEDFEFGARLYVHVEKVYRTLDKVVTLRPSIDSHFMSEVLQLAANAQCLLKTWCIETGVRQYYYDGVQNHAYRLLSDFRRKNYPTILIANMKKEDVIPIENLDDEIAKSETISREADSIVSRGKGVENSLRLLEWHSKRLAESDDPSAESMTHDWNKVVEAVTTLCGEYDMPYSSKRIREPLAALIDKTPEGLETTEEFVRVVQQIDVYLESEREREEEMWNWALSLTMGEDESDEVRAVRKEFGGSKVVFIGGTPQDHLRNRLQKKLDFELIWFETSHGASLDQFNPYLRDPEVKLFLVYIPWCSHKHSIELSALVRDAGKHFVRIRKGTSPELIAHAICEQIPQIMRADEKTSDDVDAA